MKCLIFLLLAAIAAYALARLASVMTRIEEAKLQALAAEIQQQPPPPYGYREFARDFLAAVLLSLIALACLILTFAL